MALKLRRSAVAGKVPTTAQLELGELAVNTYDGRLFLKKDDGTEEIKEIGAEGPSSSDKIGLNDRELADMGNDGDGTIAFDASEGFYGTAQSSLYSSPALFWSRHNVVAGAGINVTYDANGRPTLSGGGVTRTVYDASAVWINDVSANALVMVELWGAGGGGGSFSNDNRGGGGGGAGVRAFFKASDLGASETITVAAASPRQTDGGNSTFGSHLTAYGGTRGFYNAAGQGGGEIGVGTSSVGGGSGNGGDAKTIHGGGAGGVNGPDGGGAVYGGGGGGWSAGGQSLFGGNGGSANVAGSRPGGGGGTNATGAAGRCIITVFGG